MRRRMWLAVALLLFAAAAFLMSRGDEPPGKPAPQVDFPNHLRPAEFRRMERRRTLPAPAPASQGEPGAPSPVHQPLRDPVLAALPAVEGSSAVIFEANALRHSPVGELLLDCLRGDGGVGGADPFATARRELGFDPLEDVDRIAFAGVGVTLVSGHFADLRWEKLDGGIEFTPYGEKGRLASDAGGNQFLAAWGDEMILIGEERAALEAAIDRLEGRADATPAIDESITYGEIYGLIAPEQLAELLPRDGGLRERLLQAAERIELHVDATKDVAVYASVEGERADLVGNLGRSLGAALAVARLKARADGEEALVELLDLARVQPYGDRFALELALPLDLLQAHLGRACRGGRDRASSPPTPEATE